jgi:hypothetical protein
MSVFRPPVTRSSLGVPALSSAREGSRVSCKGLPQPGRRPIRARPGASKRRARLAVWGQRTAGAGRVPPGAAGHQRRGASASLLRAVCAVVVLASRQAYGWPGRSTIHPSKIHNHPPIQEPPIEQTKAYHSIKPCMEGHQWSFVQADMAAHPWSGHWRILKPIRLAQ